MFRRFQNLSIALCVTTALSAVATSAHAQMEANAGQFNEIIVTARSQGESLMDVPVAVTALTAEDVARYATTDLVKLAGVRPDVEIYTGGSKTGAAFVVRGVGTTADTAGVESSVSIAIDGIQTVRPRIAIEGLFDIAQVEIMKGPQALFFGKNSSAGVVSIKSANPTDELSGFIRGGYELEAHERYTEAAISIPITETLKARFAGRYSKMRGWVKNISVDTPDPQNPSVILPAAHHRYNGLESMGGRVTLLWEPSSNYSANFKATFSGTNGTAHANAEVLCPSGKAISLKKYVEPLIDCKLNGVTAANDLPPLYTKVPTGFGFDNRYDNGIDQSESDSMLLSLEQNLDLGQFSIRSNTGYTKSSFAYRASSNSGAVAPYAGGTNERFEGFSQELRLVSDFDGPFNFTVGAFYEDTKLESGATLFIAQLGPDPTTGSYISGINEALYKQKTWSGFAQARYKITPELELAGGARYTKVKKYALQGQPHYVHDLLEVPGFEALLPEGVLLEDRLTEDNWSPEATLTWQPSNDHTLYAAYKTGYKTGGIAQPAIVTPADVGNTIFDPEKSKGGEIGYKGFLADRRIRAQVTAFYYKFKGLQLTSFDPERSAYRISNAADVTQKGIEADLDFKVSENFSIRAAAAYLSVKYGSFTGANCWANQTVADGCVDPDGAGPLPAAQDFTGKQLHRAPKFVATAGFTYDAPINESGNLRFGFSSDLRFRTGTYTGESRNPAGYQGKNAQLHASARLYDEDKGWELAIIGRNLTNKRLIGFTSDRPGGQTLGNYESFAYTIRPREIALQAGLKF